MDLKAAAHELPQYYCSLRNIFEAGELRPEAVVRSFWITENKPYDTDLDVS